MGNPFLISGAVLSVIAALLHLGCIIFGATWYRFFGAGERMAQLATAGSWLPALITSVIALVLATWALYAFSAAGVIPKLPLLRTAICIITSIYLLRGLAGFVFAMFAPGSNGATFWWWSSAICLTIGAVHMVGTWQVWPQLSRGAA